MRRTCIFLLSIFLVVCGGGVASALEFTNSNTWQGPIDSNGTTPEKWLQLNLPTQINNGWDYNSDYVSKFDITLQYKTTYRDTIEVFLDFDSNHSGYYNKPNWIVQINPINDDSDHNYSFSILDLGLEDLFDGMSSFWIGYGCHFDHGYTKVEIEQNPVPEPATMLLLGSGLLGLAGLRRRFKRS